jgi:hypothetical protein
MLGFAQYTPTYEPDPYDYTHTHTRTLTRPNILATLPVRLFPSLVDVLETLTRFDSGSLPIQRVDDYFATECPDHITREVDHLTEDISLAQATLADFIVPRYLAFGDYIGDTVEASNVRSFLKDHADNPAVYRYFGSHGYEGIAIALWGLVEDGTSSAIADDLASLNQYPVLDEDDYSNLEYDLRSEHIEDPHGLPYEVRGTLKELYGATSQIAQYFEDTLTAAQQSAHIYAAFDRDDMLDNGDFGYETHNSAWYNSDKLPLLARNIAQHIYTLAAERRRILATHTARLLAGPHFASTHNAYLTLREPTAPWYRAIERLGTAYALYWALETEYLNS